MSSVHFDVVRPARYDRAQLAVRLVVFALLGLIGAPLGWFIGVLYIGLPAFAAVAIGDRGAARYLEELGPRVERGLRWLLALYAYTGLLTDRLPLSLAPREVTFSLERRGTPTVRSALLHLVTGLPSLLLLAVLGFIGGLLWLVAFVSVLVARDYPQWLFDYQRGVLRLVARLFAYQASLVDTPTPLAIDTGAEAPPPMLPKGT